MMRLGRPAALVAGSAILATTLELIGLPAGLLLGPMIVGIALAATGWGLTLPRWLSRAGQSVIGVLISTIFTPDLLRTVAHQPLLFIGTTAATVAVSVAAGELLTRCRALPGTVAIWGSMPGAATAMTLMAKSFGADTRLVAAMTFSRVACVAALASVIAAAIGGSPGGALHGPGAGWFPAIHGWAFGATIAIALGGAVGGIAIGLPAGALLGPMILGGVVALTGSVHVELPGWLLAISYALVGWTIGLGFTRDVLRTAAHAMPRILLSVAALIAFGAALGLLIARITGRDLLTCYLATSPGGADSAAIIASESHVDLPFVMAMQVFRFLAVLAIGPMLAKGMAKRHTD